MAKAIFFNVPTSGHINPTLPVVAELVRRDEEIIYMLTPAHKDKIEQTGATFRAYDAIGDDYFDRYGLDGSKPPQTAAILAQTTEAILPDLLTLIEQEKPDYLIHDSMCPWGWLAGKVTGLPTVSSTTLLALTPAMLLRSGIFFTLAGMVVRTLGDALQFERARGRLRRKYGVPIPSLVDFLTLTSTLTVSYTSRMFQPDADKLPHQVAYVGPSLQPRTDTSHFPFDALDERPLIYASLGTVINQNVGFYEACLQAFADSPYQLVLSIGERTAIEALGTLPNNTIVRNFVPQLAILERASLFISHGGMNSVHESLYYDVPLVIVPQQSEQMLVAKRVADLGAGQSLKREQATPTHLRAAAEAILSNATYATQAQKVGESLRAAGGYQRAADEIMQLILR